MRLSYLSLAVFSLLPSSQATICPPFLPILPISSPIVNTTAIHNLISTLNTTLNSLTKNISYLGNPNTSFSLEIYSLTDAIPLFTYHFSAPNLVHPSYGVSHVNSSTIYMTGSVTKAITIYTYLTNLGFTHWHSPITDFILELTSHASSHHDPLSTLDWSSITIGQLATHLSSLPRSTGPSPASDTAYRLAAHLPRVPASPGKFCAGYPCDRNSTLTNLLSRHPITTPGSTPIYSNIAYQILAWALESITATPFDSLVAELMTKLSLTESYYPIPPASSFEKAIIPGDPETAGYGMSYRSDAPSGALYSSIDDMRKIGQTILNSTFLPRSVTGMWLKPISFTPDRGVAVGAPWEILSFPPPSGTGRGGTGGTESAARFPVEVVSKAGDIGVYSAIMGLIPEFGVGFTVMSAGERASAVTREVSDLILEGLIPAMKNVSFEIAREGRYGGRYVDGGTNSSIILKVVPGRAAEMGGRPYLQLVDWKWEGVPLLEVIAARLGIADPTEAGLQFNLYPTGLKQILSNGTRIESWRASYSTKTGAGVGGVRYGTGPFSTQCESWTEVDGFVYGGVSFDEFLLEVGKDGRVRSVEARVLQRGEWERERERDGGAQRVIRERDGIRMARIREEF